MKKTTFVFVALVLACLAILYYEADRGSTPAIVVLAVTGTATLILLGGGLVLAYSYIQAEMEDRRSRRREAEDYHRSIEAQAWKAFIEESRRRPQFPAQLPTGDVAAQFPVEQPAQSFAATSDVPDWLRDE